MDWIPDGCGLLNFWLLYVFFPNGTEDGWVWVTVLILISGGFYIILESLFFKIDIFMNEDYFLFKKIFGKPQKSIIVIVLATNVL